MATLQTKQRLSGCVAVAGVLCAAVGLGGFFGWPGSLLGVGLTLWVFSTVADKIIAERKRDELRADRSGKEPI